MSLRTVTMGALGFSLAAELGLAVTGLVSPQTMMAQFHLKGTQDVRFLLDMVCWHLFVLVSMCAFAIRLVQQGQRMGYYMALTLGLIWVGFTASAVFHYQRYSILALDGTRGAMLILLSLLNLGRTAMPEAANAARRRSARKQKD